MDSQGQLQRTHHARHQAEEPIKIHHPEEGEHHEKGPSKVLKKVKEKAKKIKNVLTKHGHSHEHDRGEHIPDDHDLDQEDDGDHYRDQQIRAGAAARGKAHIPVKYEIVPPGTKAFPVVPSSHTKHSEPNRGVGHEAMPHPVKHSGVPKREESGGASTLTPHNTPVSLPSAAEDVTRTFVPGGDKSRDQRKGNTERPRGLEQDPAAPGSHGGGMSNYQSKVTDPTHGKASGETGAATTVSALGRLGLGTDFGKKSHGFDTKSEPEMGKHLPAGNYGSGLRKESPERSDEFDLGRDLPTRTQGIQNREGVDLKSHERGDEMHQSNQSSYTDKIALATSAVADKAVAAKNAVASKLGYSGEGGGVHQNRLEGEETPSSGVGYGSTVAGMVTPVYEKVKETGASVMTKFPFSGTGGTETGQDKGVSAKEYLTEKLSPGEEDKVLSEVVAEKLHLGGGETGPAKKGIVTQSEEVEKRLGGFKDPSSEAAMKHGKAYADEGEGGMVEKLSGAVTSWLAGTTEEVTQKATQSVQDSSQSLGSTVGNKMGLSGGDEAGQPGGNGGSVPLQRRFQESGN
ncbi:PREDICTED: low-temperature-induced 65 kDa protein-like isoform X1 [Camelina sativa]|uniref:Low-temperature-induced 65 kDa protein-like isoform X1 n=1 Tax=Camelina sativa TaxID=90675 RepID=A0ABM0TZE0_CAMSA|nr:PREDICTED: low-temperature-induced 65 kDa protein-like isoform X1 [Camelina sativa]